VCTPVRKELKWEGDGASTAVAVFPQDGRQCLSAVDGAAPIATRQPVQAGVVCAAARDFAPAARQSSVTGVLAAGGCAARGSWRVPVLNHRCCLFADVPPLNMRVRFFRAPGAVHEQRLRWRAKGSVRQLWLRQERGATSSPHL
jgi:hypothetical protein